MDILFLLILSVIYLFCIKQVDVYFRHNIKSAFSLKCAIIERERLYRFRKSCYDTYNVIFIVIIALDIIGVFITYGYERILLSLVAAMYMLSTIHTLYHLYFRKKYFLGNIYNWTTNSFNYKDKKYVLYLRGFKSDSYDNQFTLNDEIPFYYDRFNEYNFMQYVSRCIETLAVGMTKELDAPYGASRIYLNFKTWKEEVNELISNSTRNVILVDDRESCVWEIERCLEFLDKTVFIVFDVEKYEKVRSMLARYDIFPEIEDLNEICDNEYKAFYALAYENGKLNIYSSENTEDCYLQLINALVLKDEGKVYDVKLKAHERVLHTLKRRMKCQLYFFIIMAIAGVVCDIYEFIKYGGL